MQRLNLSFLFVLFFTASIVTCAQKKDDVIARIGKEKITTEDFQERFELIPHVGVNEANLDSAKFEFLCTLMAEKLWGMEASKLGFDTSETIRYSYKELEKLYVRDALFKEVIGSKVDVPKDEIIKGLFRKKITLSVHALKTSDSVEAYQLYDKLKGGAKFDSLLHTRPECAEQDTGGIQVTYGMMEENIEDTLYSLANGEYSVPVKNRGEWFIYYVFGRRETIMPAQQDENTTLSQVKKIAEDRVTIREYGKFYDKFFLGKKVEANGTLFWALADKMIAAVMANRKNPDLAKRDNIFVTTEDMLKIEKQLGPDTLNMVIATLDNKSITLKQLTRNFMFDGFYTNKTQPKVIAAQLNARLKTFLEQEMLADEAYRKGLQNLPEVKKETEMWRADYLGRLYKNQFKDSAKVSDAELRNYFDEKDKIKNKTITQVNILEVLTDSLDVVQKVLDDLKAGRDFREIAREHTKRIWTRESGGEFGFFPTSMYGELGRTAEKMHKGEVYGPLKLPEGYSIFKVIDKKTDADTVKKTFEAVKDQLKKERFSEKYQSILVNKTIELAKEYGVTVNRQVLSNLKTNNYNMYTYRYMGFGGRIAAVPFPSPLYEWYAPYVQNRKDLP